MQLLATGVHADRGCLQLAQRGEEAQTVRLATQKYDTGRLGPALQAHTDTVLVRLESTGTGTVSRKFYKHA
jgi:hypothetical protein